MTLVFRNKDMDKKTLCYLIKCMCIISTVFLILIYQQHKTLQYRYNYLKPSVVKVNNLVYNTNALSIIANGNLLTPSSLGTGTFIDKHYILTASHVVEDADGLTVEINKKIYSATLLHNSPIRDYAVLYIPEYEGTPVEIGDSSKLKVGDAVLILGNPLGILYVLGYGFISAPNQDIEGTETFYIQSWTQANPGNSGGALFNDNNEIIGVVVRHANNNFDFSVPINEIKEHVWRVIAKHKKELDKSKQVGYDK